MGKKDLNKLTFSELQKEASGLDKKRRNTYKKKVGVWNIGLNYFIRTVTMSLLGKLVGVTEQELVLEEASWIADTGRFADFLKGKPSSSLEVEPFPKGKVIVGRGALVDACEWNNKLLTEQK